MGDRAIGTAVAPGSRPADFMIAVLPVHGHTRALPVRCRVLIDSPILASVRKKWADPVRSAGRCPKESDIDPEAVFYDTYGDSLRWWASPWTRVAA
jgi:hypothetical protein